MNEKLKRLKLKDLMDMVLIAIIPLPLFFYYAIHFYKMFAANDIIGRNVCLIIIGAFLWGMIDIIRHFLSIIHEHDYLNRFQESFSSEKEVPHVQELSESIIGKRYQTLISLKNSLSDISHPMLTEIISSRESGRHILVRYIMGACVMLGLFGSFLGLLETVGGAYSAIESIGNSEQLLNSLSRPLSGMSLTFGTSVLGIIASLSLGFSFIFLSRRQILFLSDLEAFTQTALIPAMSVSSGKRHRDVLEKLENIEKNTGSLADIRDGIQQDTKKLFAALDGHYLNLARTTQDQIAENTGALLDVQQGIRRDAEKTFSSVDTHYSNLSQTIKETLEQTMSDLKDNISDSFSSLAESTTRSVTGMGSIMETSVAEINGSMSKEMRSFLSDERKALEGLMARIDRFSDKGLQATQFLSENMTGEIQDFLAGERVQIREMIGEINASSQTNMESARLLLADHTRTTQEQMHTFLADTMKSSQGVMDSFTEKYSQFFEQEVSRATSNLEKKTSPVIQEAMKNNKALFEQNMALFSRTSEEFKSLGLTLQNMHDLYSDRLDQTAQAMDHAISGFSKTLEQKQSTNEELTERNDQIATLLREVAALLQSNQAEMQAGLAMFVQGVDNLLTSFQIKEKDKEAEKTMVENLEKSLNTLTEKSENILLEYVARSREIYSGLLDNQLHLTRKIKELTGDN